MGSPHQIARPATVAVVSQTTATRMSTRRWPSRRKNGSCRVERLRPFHWPRRASFLTDPNIKVGHQDAKVPGLAAVRRTAQAVLRTAAKRLALGPPPARLIILISLDNRLDRSEK